MESLTGSPKRATLSDLETFTSSSAGGSGASRKRTGNGAGSDADSVTGVGGGSGRGRRAGSEDSRGQLDQEYSSSSETRSR